MSTQRSTERSSRRRISTTQLAAFGVATLGVAAAEQGVAQAHLGYQTVYRTPFCMVNSSGAGGPYRSPLSMENEVSGRDNCSKVVSYAWIDAYILNTAGQAVTDAIQAHGYADIEKGGLNHELVRDTFVLYNDAHHHEMKGTSYRIP
jgi:hypothetical protein